MRFCTRVPAPSNEHDLDVFTSNEAMQRLRQKWNLDPNQTLVPIAIPAPNGHIILSLKSSPEFNNKPSGRTEANEKQIPVYVTPSFLHHYDVRLEDRPLVTHVKKVIPLTRVLIGTRIPLNQVSAQSLRSDDDEEGICRMGECYQRNQDMIVMECSPVRQGLVTRDTSLTLVHLNDQQMKCFRI